jgi:hypothetical protein
MSMASPLTSGGDGCIEKTVPGGCSICIQGTQLGIYFVRLNLQDSFKFDCVKRFRTISQLIYTIVVISFSSLI